MPRSQRVVCPNIPVFLLFIRRHIYTQNLLTKLVMLSLIRISTYCRLTTTSLTSGDVAKSLHSYTSGDVAISLHPYTFGDVAKSLHSYTSGDVAKSLHSCTSGDVAKCLHSYTSGYIAKSLHSYTSGYIAKSLHSYTSGYIAKSLHSYTSGDVATSLHSYSVRTRILHRWVRRWSDLSTRHHIKSRLKARVGEVICAEMSSSRLP